MFRCNSSLSPPYTWTNRDVRGEPAAIFPIHPASQFYIIFYAVYVFSSELPLSPLCQWSFSTQLQEHLSQTSLYFSPLYFSCFLFENIFCSFFYILILSPFRKRLWSNLPLSDREYVTLTMANAEWHSVLSTFGTKQKKTNPNPPTKKEPLPNYPKNW